MEMPGTWISSAGLAFYGKSESKAEGDMEWWRGFFDADYVHLWSELIPPSRSEQEATALWSLLGVERGSRVLDAPCGYGRLSRELALRGASVVGVDISSELLAEAERRRGEIPDQQLKYIRHDLRHPLPENGFDAAINIFSSLGYATEEDDLAILGTLRAAVREGGRVFIETMHRDVLAALRSRGVKTAQRLSDGTLIIEEAQFDPVAGRAEMTWYLSGPRGSGSKSGSVRAYTITELVKLLARVGLMLRSTHRGCSSEPFRPEGPEMGGRVGLLTERTSG